MFDQGFGYIAIRGTSVNNYSRAPIEATKSNGELATWMNTPVAQFTVNLESHPFVVKPEGDCWLCSDYPAYYSFVDGKLILIYDEAMREVFGRRQFTLLSKKSVKKLCRITDPYLKASLDENFLFHDPLSKDRPEFRLDSKQRKQLSKHEVYKMAAQTLETPREVHVLMRNGTVEAGGIEEN